METFCRSVSSILPDYTASHPRIGILSEGLLLDWHVCSKLARSSAVPRDELSGVSLWVYLMTEAEPVSETLRNQNVVKVEVVLCLMKHHVRRSVEEWRYSSTVLDLIPSWRLVVSSIPLPLYLLGSRTLYPLDKLGGHQSRSGRCAGERNLSPLLGIVPSLYHLSYADSLTKMRWVTISESSSLWTPGLSNHSS
jgi:hypothetical protein